MKSFLLFLGCCLLSGCATISTPMSFTTAGDSRIRKPLLFDHPVKSSARLKRFMERYPRCREREKIAYLLNGMRSSSAIFIRNGNQYNGVDAARWLAWKKNHRQFHDDPILTAWDFVNRVAVRSKNTGMPYEIIFSDGRRQNLRDVLRTELILLESVIRQKGMERVITSKLSFYPRVFPERRQAVFVFSGTSVGQR